MELCVVSGAAVRWVMASLGQLHGMMRHTSHHATHHAILLSRTQPSSCGLSLLRRIQGSNVAYVDASGDVAQSAVDVLHEQRTGRLGLKRHTRNRTGRAVLATFLTHTCICHLRSCLYSLEESYHRSIVPALCTFPAFRGALSRDPLGRPGRQRSAVIPCCANSQ